ncbi:MAG: hypothetical protein M1818_004011 [Claussenomyces sp. TS43310]|nr:MAG: hypothetical protein M1818_004011 [Claussenomyces sp. TS43310]
MARACSIPEILAQIQDSASSAGQITALRALKNDIIGHPQRKARWIAHGALEPVIRVLHPTFARSRQNEKREDDMLHLQALCIVGSLAHGGPALLRTSQTIPVLPAILSHLCPLNNSPQMVLAALQALSNLADSISSNPGDTSPNSIMLADNLFQRPNVYFLCRILLQTPSTPLLQRQTSLVVSLISKLCREERHQQNLASAGALDSLAAKLAEIVVAQGLVIPGADLLVQKEGTAKRFSFESAHQTMDLAGILEAISTIIAHSKFRATQLAFSEAIQAVFPISPELDFKPSQATRAAWNSFSTADSNIRQSEPNAIDFLIPQIPISPSRASSAIGSAFPPLGTLGSFEHIVQLGRVKTTGWPRIASFEKSQHEPFSDSAEPETPLIAYLIWLARSTRELERLAAISVLAVLYRAGLARKSRETAVGLLIVPLLVQLLDEGNADPPKDIEAAAYIELQRTRWSIQERAPAVLAMLIVDSEYLQNTAYDAGVISRLAKILKLSYDPVLDTSQGDTWSPAAEKDRTTSSDPESSQPGHTISPLLVHKIKVRESALRAIAALVPFKDEYRKALIDQGVVPYLVESLRPLPDKPTPKVLEKTEKGANVSTYGETSPSGYGINPVSVLIAACGAVRHLSRSVSILRTTLIDNGVVMPVFALLKHSDIEVQIAATAVVCNFVTEFSPMRETIAAAGVLKILCEHAHSGNVKLRLNALWALKHLVHSADNDIKKTCLEELGQGWLVQLICDNTEDGSVSSQIAESGKGSHNEHMDDNMQVDRLEDGDGLRLADSLGMPGNISSIDSKQAITDLHASSLPGTAFTASTRLAALQDLETDPARRARKDDIAVQEQGLEFIRNLIGAANTAGSSETSEMIDFLFNALGQDQIFEILAAKLRPKVVNPYNRRNSAANGETRVIPPQAEIVTAVGYILVHMAASVPRHRQLLISQTDLLKLLVPQFNHPNKEVRVALCWLATNLTWMDDIPDHPACAQRAHELKKLGFLAKLEGLEHDSELDVKERAKTAVYQMKQHGC